MKSIFAIAILLLVPAMLAGAANPAQSGTGTTCAEWNALYAADLSTGLSVVTVQADTKYVIGADRGAVTVDFYTQDGTWLTWSEAGTTGTVPTGASYGVMCTGDASLGYPMIPDPTATWTYQDGL